MELSVREVRPDDAEAIVQILNPIIKARTFTVFDSPFSVEDEREYISNFPEQGVFQVSVRCEGAGVPKHGTVRELHPRL